jgi:hypothetical protein
MGIHRDNAERALLESGLSPADRTRFLDRFVSSLQAANEGSRETFSFDDLAQTPEQMAALTRFATEMNLAIQAGET